MGVEVRVLSLALAEEPRLFVRPGYSLRYAAVAHASAKPKREQIGVLDHKV